MIGTNGRVVFSQSQFEPYIPIHMAVGQMMYHLLDRPSIRTISIVQLVFSAVFDQCFNVFREYAQYSHLSSKDPGSGIGIRNIFPDRVFQFFYVHSLTVMHPFSFKYHRHPFVDPGFTSFTLLSSRNVDQITTLSAGCESFKR